MQNVVRGLANQMSQYPAGAWALDELESVASWVDAIRTVPASRDLKKIVSALFELGARLDEMADPDEGVDELDSDPPVVPGIPSSGLSGEPSLAPRMVSVSLMVNEPGVSEGFRI